MLLIHPMELFKQKISIFSNIATPAPGFRHLGIFLFQGQVLGLKFAIVFKQLNFLSHQGISFRLSALKMSPQLQLVCFLIFAIEVDNLLFKPPNIAGGFLCFFKELGVLLFDIFHFILIFF